MPPAQRAEVVTETSARPRAGVGGRSVWRGWSLVKGALQADRAGLAPRCAPSLSLCCSHRPGADSFSEVLHLFSNLSPFVHVALGLLLPSSRVQLVRFRPGLHFNRTAAIVGVWLPSAGLKYN